MELAAAVSNAGGLGSVPTSLHKAAQVRDDVARLRGLTDRPFAVNMTRRPFDVEVFGAVLAIPPSVFSLALGEPGDLVARVHDAGAVPRSLRTRFVEEWNARPEGAAEALRTRVLTTMRDGTAHQLIALTGQSAGLIGEPAPAGEIVDRIGSEAGATIRAMGGLISTGHAR